MKRMGIVPILVLGISFGCGHRRHKAPPPAPAPAAETRTVPPAKPSSCEIIRSELNENIVASSTEEAVYHVERHFQRVVRKDCKGQVESDKIETVRSPHVGITLHAPEEKAFKAVFVFNQDSCDHVLSIMPLTNFPLIGLLYRVTGDGKSEISLKGDLADAALTFQLKPGMNRLFVRYFYDCAPSLVNGNKHAINGEATCEKSEDSVAVLYPIKIEYEEKHRDGFREIEKNPESCKTKE